MSSEPQTTAVTRQPVIGVLTATSRTRIYLNPPMRLPHEQPALLTSAPSQVVIVGGTDSWIDVENRADHDLTYVLIVIPALVGRALVAPWREAARILKAGASDPATLRRVGTALVRGLLNRVIREVPK